MEDRERIQKEIDELLILMGQAEAVIAKLRQLIPAKGDWKAWRLRQSERQLAACRADLKALVDQAQVLILQEYIVAKELAKRI